MITNFVKCLHSNKVGLINSRYYRVNYKISSYNTSLNRGKIGFVDLSFAFHQKTIITIKVNSISDVKKIQNNKF